MCQKDSTQRPPTLQIPGRHLNFRLVNPFPLFLVPYPGAKDAHVYRLKNSCSCTARVRVEQTIRRSLGNSLMKTGYLFGDRSARVRGVESSEFMERTMGIKRTSEAWEASINT